MEAMIDPRWRKASYSDNGGNCVEVGQARRGVLIRDTQDRADSVLRFSPDAWRKFADQVKRSLQSGPPRPGTRTLVKGALSGPRVPFACPGVLPAGHLLVSRWA
jgi:hypothetical protein